MLPKLLFYVLGIFGQSLLRKRLSAKNRVAWET